jgi:hypothetical protein
MKRFRTGNVVRDGKKLRIVVGYKYYPKSEFEEKAHYCLNWIAFDAANVSGLTRTDDHQTSTSCFCYDQDDYDIENECTYCHNTGSYLIDVKGTDAWEYVAENVKAYIIDSITKNFGF